MPSARARDEIVKSLSTLVLVYTIRPTPEECAIIAKKLINKFPVLKDNQGNGYVSRSATEDAHNFNKPLLCLEHSSFLLDGI